MTTRTLVVVAEPTLLAAIEAALVGTDPAWISAGSPEEALLIAEIEAPAALIVSASALAAGATALTAALRLCGGTGACLVEETGHAGDASSAPAPGSFTIVGGVAALEGWVASIPRRAAIEPEALDPVEALRAAYRASLPEKARGLAALVAAASAERSDPERIAAARRLAHRLRGSAGTFGYWAFGALAGEIDDALAEEGGQGRWGVIEAALRRLARWSS